MLTYYFRAAKDSMGMSLGQAVAGRVGSPHLQLADARHGSIKKNQKHSGSQSSLAVLSSQAMHCQVGGHQGG